jgi:hypothetical protein
MKKSYQIIAKSGQGNEHFVTHAVPAQGSFWGALKIKAKPGVHYQLVDLATGQAPDNIRVKRSGKDLRISFEGHENIDAMIIDYYEYMGNEGLTGESERGALHVYVPESGDSAQLVGRLPDGANSIGMALGQAQWMASSSSGAMVAAAGFNPLLAAPLALLALAGAGGGGGADTTPPQVRSVRLAPEDDTGVSNSDGITSDNTPQLLISADAGAVSATVTLNGKTYTSTTKNAQGQFVVQIPDADALGNGEAKYSVVVTDASGKSSPPSAGSFIVDRSASDNYQPDAVKDPNEAIAAQVNKITQDTGFSATDFITSDNTLSFQGALGNAFVNNGDLVELRLLNAQGQFVAGQYVEPENRGGLWTWAWDNSAQILADGSYTLTSQVVDKAGNGVGAGPSEQKITVDTNAVPDPVSGFSIAVTQMGQDSSASPSFLSNQITPSFRGNIGDSNVDFTGKVLVQVLGTDGKVKSQSYVDPASNGTWIYDGISQPLGISKVNTQYVLKASVVDLAGNLLKSTDQSFTVDLKPGAFSVAGGEDVNGVLFFRQMTLKADEPGVFSYQPLPVGQSSTLVFAAGEFEITFTDLAGNVYKSSNNTRWEFRLTELFEVIPKTSDSPFTFGEGELAGSIGRLDFDAAFQSLDLSSLYSSSPGVGDVAAINHIVMTDGAGNDTLKLTTGDVLQLGVKNSFLSNSRQQMRIDGDSGDRVELDDLLGGSSFAWTKANDPVVLDERNYDVYANTSLNLELFIQKTINTQLL